MLIDDLHTQPGDVLRLKAVAHQFVRDDLGSTDLMAVIHTNRPAGNQTFTNDQQQLTAAIDRTGGAEGGRQLTQGDGYSFDEMQAADARSTLATLQSVVSRLVNLKTRRKALLLFSGGIDYDIRNLVPDDGGHALMNVEPGARTSSNQWGTAVMDAMRTAIDAAMRANVAVYSRSIRAGWRRRADWRKTVCVRWPRRPAERPSSVATISVGRSSVSSPTAARICPGLRGGRPSRRQVSQDRGSCEPAGPDGEGAARYFGQSRM